MSKYLFSKGKNKIYVSEDFVIDYGDIKIHRKTINDLKEKQENLVVLEFVIKLLNIGYNSENIVLEKPFYLTLIYVVLFPGLASFIFWIKGIALIGANRAGIFLHLMPIFSAVMAMLIFNEKFMFYHLLGAIFILIGLILSNKKKYD